MDLVYINYVGFSELSRVPGIGSKLAKEIIYKRSQYGDLILEDLEDLPSFISTPGLDRILNFAPSMSGNESDERYENPKVSVSFPRIHSPRRSVDHSRVHLNERYENRTRPPTQRSITYELERKKRSRSFDYRVLSAPLCGHDFARQLHARNRLPAQRASSPRDQRSNSQRSNSQENPYTDYLPRAKAQYYEHEPEDYDPSYDSEGYPIHETSGQSRIPRCSQNREHVSHQCAPVPRVRPQSREQHFPPPESGSRPSQYFPPPARNNGRNRGDALRSIESRLTKLENQMEIILAKLNTMMMSSQRQSRSPSPESGDFGRDFPLLNHAHQGMSMVQYPSQSRVPEPGYPSQYLVPQQPNLLSPTYSRPQGQVHAMAPSNETSVGDRAGLVSLDAGGSIGGEGESEWCITMEERLLRRMSVVRITELCHREGGGVGEGVVL
jgi:hypothetical protein